jgi:hypothetical protein
LTLLAASAADRFSLPAASSAAGECWSPGSELGCSSVGASWQSGELPWRLPRSRDTPPQHIAARHRQAEGAAREELRRALALSGASAALLRGGGE